MLRLTGDDSIKEVFLDGVKQTVPETLWNKQVEIPVKSQPRLIAIQAYNAINPNIRVNLAGLLASMTDTDGEDLILTNDTWRCSNELESGWETVEFREYSDNWSNAVVIANHGKGVWGRVAGYVNTNFGSFEARNLGA